MVSELIKEEPSHYIRKILFKQSLPTNYSYVFCNNSFYSIWFIDHDDIFNAMVRRYIICFLCTI